MKFVLSLLLVVLAVPAFAAQAPFPLWLDSMGNYQDLSGEYPLRTPSSTDSGAYNQKTVQFTFDSQAWLAGNIGDYALGAYLPAGAVIIRSYFKILTQFTDSGSGTVALSCEDANNIKTATDITGSSANAFVEGQSTGAASAFVRGIAARCEITATIAGVAQTAGKLQGWVTYVIEQ